MEKREGSIKGQGKARVAGKAVVIALSAALMLSAVAGSATAGSHEGRRAGDMRRAGHYESIYGTVENLPKDLVGVWTVDGREIVVTADTLIKEEHGKVVPGAYVKVEGSTSGNTFTAREIEVKRQNRR